MDKWLSYDQVSLIPTVVSSLEHRAETDTSVQFGPAKLSLPLIAAPMPDVTNGAMARKLRDLGSFGWVHRFQSVDQQRRELIEDGFEANGKIGVAIPANTEEAASIVDRLYNEFGTRVFCIDTANGANTMVEKAIKTLKDGYPDIFIVTGNVASGQTFDRLDFWGADAIRVGIAGGSVCETRTETGVYSPMASVIEHVINDRMNPRKALLIADGGITSPGDMCKALALGADLVMAGGIFAGTDESPGQVLKDRTGRKVKILRGAASYSVQNGQSEYNEGAETFADYQGSVEKIIKRYAAGLRSSMSYMNARTLDEYRKNVKVVEI